ncbi:MAG: putative sigma-54 modulation protein [Cryomorphaceae bacterium]|jgi:putative sigma-54 modulation protein
MQTAIHSSDFALTTALENFIHQQAGKSMNVCADRVERLVVRLRDVNGPRGGQDKECSVEVKLAHCEPIVVSKRSSDAYSSIRKALSRASRVTLRRIDKRRARKYVAPVQAQIQALGADESALESQDDSTLRTY